MLSGACVPSPAHALWSTATAAIMAVSSAAAAGGGRRWYFTREQLARSPSWRLGLDPDKELSYRQQAANLLQDMGQRLNVSQLTINTAIVYMHRFYMVQSFTHFHRNAVAPAALFLAAKVEEQPRKLEHVIKVTHACLHPLEAAPDTRSEGYLQQAQDLVILESIILQTLGKFSKRTGCFMNLRPRNVPQNGESNPTPVFFTADQYGKPSVQATVLVIMAGFEITIDHPHTHVVKCTQLVRASKDLAQTSYFMATNSLHLTTFSLQYTPPVVACVCIHLACKWSNWEIPVSTDGKHWWEYVDATVTLELLDELTHEFLQILEKTPNRLKRIRNWRACQAAARKSKTDDQSEDDGLSEQTILSMISRSASDTTIAGLMSMSTSSTTGTTASLPATEGESPEERGSTDISSDSWMAQHPPHKQEVSHRANEISANPDHLHHDSSSGGSFVKQNIKSAPLAKVSLKEYRAKHAEELAAQKRQLENMEANVRSQYAYAAQNLLVQQQRERDVQQEENSPIVLKIPLGNNSDGSERPPTEKADKPSSAVKVRLPAPGDKPIASSKQDDIKVRIKVPPPTERHSLPDENSGKSRGEHKEKHKIHSSNHHHHHNHHSHKHSHGQPVVSTKRPGDPKHVNPTGIVSHKGYVPNCSSRKRPLSEETSVTVHEHQPKISKSSKGPTVPFAFPQHSGHSLEAAGLSFPQANKARGAHGKLDKSTAGANGHNMNQSIDYQDTVNMLHSLLSAQGMQPTQSSNFDFVHHYGEYLNPRAAASVDKPRPPPLPSEPPPPLPPLPK